MRPEEMTGEQKQCLDEFFHKTLYPAIVTL